MKINKSNKKDPESSTSKSRQPAKDPSPRFMSPTYSSAQQAALKTEQGKDRMATFSPVPTVKPRRNNWVASAVKRVGFNRLSEEVPRSRKEGLVSKTIAFRDEVSDRSRSSLRKFYPY